MSRRDLLISTSIVAATVLTIIGLVRLLSVIAEILLLILIAAILAAGISPVVVALQRLEFGRRRPRRLPQSAAILLIYAAILVVLLLMGGAIITPVVAEARQFIAQLPQFVEGLQRSAEALQARYPWLPDLSGLLGRLPRELAGLGRYFGTAAGVAFRFFGGLFSAVTVLFMTFYMLVEGPLIKHAFLTLFPEDQAKRIERVLERVGLKFGGWVRGQLLLGVIIGVVVGIGAAVLRLPYPLLLGLVAGITELIPIVGPIIGAVPAVFIAIILGPFWRVLAVIVFYTAVQQLEANFVVPRVMRMAVGLSPLLTIIALLIGGQLLGIIGVLLSVPVAAALQVVVGEILQEVREAARPEKAWPSRLAGD